MASTFTTSFTTACLPANGSAADAPGRLATAPTTRIGRGHALRAAAVRLLQFAGRNLGALSVRHRSISDRAMSDLRPTDRFHR